VEGVGRGEEGGGSCGTERPLEEGHWRAALGRGVWAPLSDDAPFRLPQSPIPPKTYKEIDAKIESFADLLKLLDENPYDPTYDYNIDLFALTHIRGELEQLNNMVGLSSLKNSVLDQMLYFLQRLHTQGKDADFMHTILCGPPGTGKTEVAKILGNMYSKMGVLKNGTFKKVTRTDLIAGYLGQTAIKTSKLITDNLGGCLFIDEAYSLAGSGDTEDIFAKECLDTLCEALSNHKHELMVIIAGYENDLNDTFFRVNRGLESRFIWRFKIDGYSGREMAAILQKKIRENSWTTDISEKTMETWFDKQKEYFSFYGRDIEILFSHSKIVHGRRIFGKTDQTKHCITMADIEAGHKKMQTNAKKKREPIPGLYV
jgi:SpoVK/Ycf46/Vps4 family AAA+-type ATPase